MTEQTEVKHRPDLPHARHVITSELAVEAMSIAIDETRAVIRFLTPLPEPFFDQIPVGKTEDLKTTKKLAAPLVPFEKIETAYFIDGKRYGVFAEGILDKTLPEFERIWHPGVHWVFYFHPLFGFRVETKGSLTMHSRKNTAELIRTLGGCWYFDLWSRSVDGPLTECSRSITTAPNTKLITNLTDLGEEETSDYVMEGGHSKWLSFNYELIPDSPTVKPDGVLYFTLKALDGVTKEPIQTATWDKLRVEAVDGYAPHKRIKMVEGIGRFRVQALGLLDGETMRVKVASRLDSCCAEATVRVKS